MRYRDDRPRCPTCADPAIGYDPMFDYLRCANGHQWDGPINGTVTWSEVNAIPERDR